MVRVAALEYVRYMFGTPAGAVLLPRTGAIGRGSSAFALSCMVFFLRECKDACFLALCFASTKGHTFLALSSIAL